jgi:hypothetical protein
MAAQSKALSVKGDGSLDSAAVMDLIRKGEKIRLVESPEDNERMAREIMDRTMNAESADALFNEGGLESGKGYINRPFRLDSVKFRNSDLEEGIGIYAILEGVTPSGEMIAVSSSAQNVVVKVIKGLELGAFPRWVKLTEDTTGKGYKVQNLVSAEGPTTDGEGKAF